MGANHKQAKSKANAIAVAWSTLANADSFGGYTLAQFQQVLADAQNKSATLGTLDAGYADAMRQRDAAHDALNAAMLNVVDGVKGNTAKYGANSSLYKAMGYVPRDERASGLTRKNGTGKTKSGNTGSTGSPGTAGTASTTNDLTWDQIRDNWDTITSTWENLGKAPATTGTTPAATTPTATTGSVKS